MPPCRAGLEQDHGFVLLVLDPRVDNIIDATPASGLRPGKVRPEVQLQDRFLKVLGTLLGAKVQTYSDIWRTVIVYIRVQRVVVPVGLVGSLLAGIRPFEKHLTRGVFTTYLDATERHEELGASGVLFRYRWTDHYSSDRTPSFVVGSLEDPDLAGFDEHWWIDGLHTGCLELLKHVHGTLEDDAFGEIGGINGLSLPYGIEVGLWNVDKLSQIRFELKRD